MFKAKTDEQMAWRIMRVRLAEKFGWTLDYVDSLDEMDIADIYGVMDGDQQLEKRRRALKR